MVFHVGFWEFDANSKDTNRQYNSREFQCDSVGHFLVSPSSRIKNIGSIRSFGRGIVSREGRAVKILSLTDDNTENECPTCFSYIQLCMIISESLRKKDKRTKHTFSLRNNVNMPN